MIEINADEQCTKSLNDAGNQKFERNCNLYEKCIGIMGY